jgi:hypothetical protein
MRIKVRKIGEGLHHSEIVVEIKTVGGIERLVVATRAVEEGSILVGAPLAQKPRGQVLVELPRETMSGAARVWVKQDALIEDKPKARAA